MATERTTFEQLWLDPNWDCPNCQAVNFAIREKCRLCGYDSNGGEFPWYNPLPPYDGLPKEGRSEMSTERAERCPGCGSNDKTVRGIWKAFECHDHWHDPTPVAVPEQAADFLKRLEREEGRVCDCEQCNELRTIAAGGKTAQPVRQRRRNDNE